MKWRAYLGPQPHPPNRTGENACQQVDGACNHNDRCSCITGALINDDKRSDFRFACRVDRHRSLTVAVLFLRAWWWSDYLKAAKAAPQPAEGGEQQQLVPAF